MGRVHHDPLQVFQRESAYEHVSQEVKRRKRRKYLPLSISWVRREGVPIPIPVRIFLRASVCSSTFMCLANWARAKSVIRAMRMRGVAFWTREEMTVQKMNKKNDGDKEDMKMMKREGKKSKSCQELTSFDM